MKFRTLALLALAAGFVAGVVVWRRRASAAPEQTVQLGASGGAVLTLDLTDPATAELQVLAAGVRDTLTGGA